jgi:MFS family permease
MEAVPASVAGTRSPRGYRVWVVAVQCLLVVGWAMYVLYLPGLLSSAGIDPRLAIAVLMLDQAIFAACDWAAGAFADRLTQQARRLGPLITSVALASSACMLAMPWIAKLGSPALLLASIVAWTATSSALRAPVFALLGRVSGVESRSGTVGWALVSLSVAGALTPILTAALAKLDPALPLGLGAAALAAAALFASRIESRFPPPAAAREDVAPALAKRWLALVVLIAAVGTQVHTAIASKPAYARVAGADADAWMPTFWIGFALALPLAVHVARGRAPLARASIALLVGAFALVVVQRVPSLAVVVAAQFAAGAAWGVLTTVVVSAAIALGGAAKAGTAAGMVFAALAAAALIRLGFVSTGLNATASIAWIPVVAWLAAGALLVARARDVEALLSVSDVRALRAG